MEKKTAKGKTVKGNQRGREIDRQFHLCTDAKTEKRGGTGKDEAAPKE